MTLRATLETLAEDTWERLRDAKALSVRFGEETITDLMMLEIVRQAFPSIVVDPTSKRKESLSGTDFELWLGSDRSGWVRLAVQAKKLHLASGNYRGFNHKVGHAKALQINLLENYAQANDAIPLYCLYNYTVNLPPLLYWHCCQGQEAFQPKQLGCTITPSSTIKETLSQYGGKNFNNIHQADRTLPWRCLACPELGQWFGVREHTSLQEPTDTLPRLFGRTRPRIYSKLPETLARERERRRTKDLDSDTRAGHIVFSSNASRENSSDTDDDSGFDRELYSRNVDFPRRRFAMEVDPYWVPSNG